MKFLILGVSGMAGHTIALYLKERGHSVDGFSRKKMDLCCDNIIGDAFENEKLTEIIQNGNYDIVVNAIGILNQFAEQHKEQAVYLNSYLPHFLAKITEKKKTRIVHISTDCVFQGNTGPYMENSVGDGKSFYARSKYLGELIDDKNVTIRTSIIGPDMNREGIGLLNWFMKQKGSINGYLHAMWTGVTTLELAKIIEEISYKKIKGLHHMVYKNNISKYKLLLLMNHYLRNDSIIINKDDKIHLDKTLIRTNFEFDYRVPDYDKMILEMTEWIKIHKLLYPHYHLE